MGKRGSSWSPWPWLRVLGKQFQWSGWGGEAAELRHACGCPGTTLARGAPTERTGTVGMPLRHLVVGKFLANRPVSIYTQGPAQIMPPFLLQTLLLWNHKHVILEHRNIKLKHTIWHFRWNVQIKSINYYTCIITLPTTLKHVLLLLDPIYRAEDIWGIFKYIYLFAIISQRLFAYVKIFLAL